MIKYSKIRYQYDDCRFSFSNRILLKSFILNLIRKEGFSCKSLDFIFTNDEALREMNVSFLKHTDYTDILTFPLSTNGEPIEGEIYISIDRIRENADKYGVSFQDELRRVIFHGVLHLCGYKDKTKKEKELMRSKEDHYLLLFKKKLR